MKKYLPSLLAAAAALAAVFAPQMQTLISSHPSVYAVLASLLAIVSHFLPSPAEKL